MNLIIMLCFLIGGAVIQTVVPSSAFIGGAKLPVLLSFVLYYALTRSVVSTMIAAFLAGFLHDVLSQIPLGHSVFCFCIAGWLAGYFRNMVLSDSIFTTLIFGGIANAITTVFFFLMLVQEDLIKYSYGMIALKIFGALLLGMICTPIVFHLAGWIDRLVGNVELEHSLDDVE